MYCQFTGRGREGDAYAYRHRAAGTTAESRSRPNVAEGRTQGQLISALARSVTTIPEQHISNEFARQHFCNQLHTCSPVGGSPSSYMRYRAQGSGGVRFSADGPNGCLCDITHICVWDHAIKNRTARSIQPSKGVFATSAGRLRRCPRGTSPWTEVEC
jgi:hypothetical protein